MLKSFFGCTSTLVLTHFIPALVGSSQSADTGDLGLSDSTKYCYFRFVRAALVLWDKVAEVGVAGTRWYRAILDKKACSIVALVEDRRPLLCPLRDQVKG